MKKYNPLFSASFRAFLTSLSVLLIILAFCGQALALDIRDVRFGLHPDKTRMVLELSEPSVFRVFTLSEPYRLVIDLPSFEWHVGSIVKPGGSGVKEIRQGPLQSGVSRIVIDLSKPMVADNAFILRAHQGKPDRLVVDFKAAAASVFEQKKGDVIGKLSYNTDAPSAATPSSAMVPPIPAVSPSSKTTLASAAVAPNAIVPARKPPAADKQRIYEKPLVVIDAGHGGADPGAISSSGILEKNISLAMAKELKAQLNASGRYKAVLTRDRDKFIRLHERVNIARKQNADLFISLHADSIGTSNVRGASIYTLSDKASDKQTELLAKRENRADLIAGVDMSGLDEDVVAMLTSLAMRDTTNQSTFFANTLVKNMQSGGVRLLESPHRSAGFAVLKAPDIPSVLIEMGFVSNNQEAQLLSSTSYRRQLGQALVRGIDAYFEKVRHDHRI